MVTKLDAYRARLRALDNWDAYLLQNSGLPGPRANLELAQAVADVGDRQVFERYIANSPDEAPSNSPYEFLVVCGIVGLGRLLAEGEASLLGVLRRFAADPRWRVREAVVLALQRLGDVDMDRLIVEMRDWSQGTPLEQRAAAAAVCEPRLLAQARHARAVLRMLDEITATLERADNRRGEGSLTLRQGLGYCWSVAVVALPVEGKLLMEKWMTASDRDVQWVMRENLRKARLVRMDADWVQEWRDRIGR